MVTRTKLRRFLEKEGRAVRATGGHGADALLHEAAAPEADSEWAAEFNAHLLKVALERVRPQVTDTPWKAFEQVWLANRTAAEVAPEVGLSVAMVYVAKSRVLKRLRAEVLLLAEEVPTLSSGEGPNLVSPGDTPS
jgi:RNA polymerase sigma-70 factor (ECF subfamily)